MSFEQDLDNRSRGSRPSPSKMDGSRFCVIKYEIEQKGVSQMSTTELTDNLTFLSALQMLGQLIQQGLLTADEGARTRRELERKLRPTLILL